MLQVAAAGADNSTQPALDLQQVQLCKGNIKKTYVARVTWPASIVNPQMSSTCHVEANEEDTLATSSPSVLFNAQYSTSQLLLTVMNTVYRYDITNALKAKCHSTCEECSKATSLENEPAPFTVTRLVGRSVADFASSKSTTQVALSEEMLYVISSYNTISTVDLSLHIPCGRIMDYLRPHFNKWVVKPDLGAESKRTATAKVNLVFEESTATWACSATKQVQGFGGALLTKYTACCSPTAGAASKIPCCVEKFSTLPALAKVSKQALAAALGAM